MKLSSDYQPIGVVSVPPCRIQLTCLLHDKNTTIKIREFFKVYAYGLVSSCYSWSHEKQKVPLNLHFRDTLKVT